MSCDFLFSLRKWLGWLVAFLMAALPQHLIAQLGNADLLPLSAYVAYFDVPPAAVDVQAPAQGHNDAKPTAAAGAGAAQTQSRPAR